MLWVRPLRFIVFDVAFRALLESHCFGRLCHSSDTFRAPVSNRVNPIKPELARPSRLFSRLRKIKGVAGADAHVPQATIGDVTENPLLRSALGNAQNTNRRHRRTCPGAS